MSTTTPLPDHPVLRASAPRAARGAGLFRTQARLFLREPVLLVWTIVVPLIILVAIGAAAGGARQDDLGGLRVIDVYVPTMAVFSLVIVGINALPPNLGNDRERGVLRRLATTPARPSRMVAAQLGVHAIAAAVSSTLIVVVGRVAFDVALPDPFLGFVVVLLLAGAAVLGLGSVIAAVAPSAKAASALGTATFFPLMFLGGLWIPRDTMSSVLVRISDLTPVGAAVGALQDVTTGGSWPSSGALIVMAVWAAAATLLAVRCFRWQ